MIFRTIRPFADDCVLYRNIKTLTDCQILQDDLNSLGQWETDWQMKFNVAKCHSMRVTRHLPSNQIHFNYSLYHQTLEQVESAKYLGITITDNVCRRWHNKSSVDDMLNDLDWPSLEDRRLKSSLTFFYKIHSGTVSLDKDKCLTPAPRLRSTRASHDSQYTRYMSNSDALKNSFFQRTIPLWNSLPSSVVASKTTEEFKALI